MEGSRDGLEILKMRPANEVIVGGVPDGATGRCLAEPGRESLIYVRGGTQADLKVTLPAGQWQVDWLNPKAAETVQTEVVAHGGGAIVLVSPAYVDDMAIRLSCTTSTI